MAKKTRHKKISHEAQVAGKKRITPPGNKNIPNPQPMTSIPKARSVPGWMVPFILLITFIAFIPALKAGFVNWDDGDYVYDNILLKDPSRLKELLTTTVQGNFHPLTMLSLAFNYLISGMDPWSYHLLNLLLHLANCILVFRLALLLGNKNPIVAFTTAVLFGIHPMHVESVAWIAERKDVLYGLFFLAGLISYTKYADTGSRKQYLLSILFLFLSLLSKPAAVIFPVVLFCIDFLRKRRLTFKLVAEKIPYAIAALIIGVITLTAQKDVGAISTHEFFGLGTRILYGFYGIMVYFIKMIFPANLSAFYPFPPVNESLPPEYYLGPLFFILLAVVVYFSLRKSRAIGFGIIFFVANLLLVLQVVAVGSAVIAERYTYIAYIGLFYALGWLVDRFSKGNISKAAYIIVPVSLLFCIISYNQSLVWTESASLWDHAIKTQPSARAYDNRATLFNKEQNYEQAREYFKAAIKINSVDDEAYANLGNAYMGLKKPDSAYMNYRKALAVKPGSYVALDNLGAWFAMRGQYDSSLKSLDEALRLKPNYEPSYKNRALTYMALKRNEDAIKDFEKYLQYSPGDADIYNAIGSCYLAMAKYPEALTSINKAIEIRPDPHFLLNRSYYYFNIKNLEEAKKDALTAREGGVHLEPGYAGALGIK